jgi:hypothetical protein
MHTYILPNFHGIDNPIVIDYNRAMKYEDLTPEQKEIYDFGFQAGKGEGVKAEQERIQYVLNMMFESALNMGQGNKAVQYKHAMDLLRPVNIDYSEEAYKRNLEADGF